MISMSQTPHFVAFLWKSRDVDGNFEYGARQTMEEEPVERDSPVPFETAIRTGGLAL